MKLLLIIKIIDLFQYIINLIFDHYNVSRPDEL